MKIEIWSDVVCPWCYLGNRRFAAALDRFEHRDEVDVVWRAYELDPKEVPEPTDDYAVLLARKSGRTVAQLEERMASITRTAAAEGLEYRYDIMRTGNTFDAHRVLHLAREHGVQGAVKERLFRGYFTEGEPIGNRDALARLAGEAGLDAGEVRAMLDTDRYAAEVRADEAQAAAFNITGVPFFVIDRAFGVSGAQPAEALLAALQHGWAAAEPAPAAADGGDACGVGDSCEV